MIHQPNESSKPKQQRIRYMNQMMSNNSRSKWLHSSITRIVYTLQITRHPSRIVLCRLDRWKMIYTIHNESMNFLYLQLKFHANRITLAILIEPKSGLAGTNSKNALSFFFLLSVYSPQFSTAFCTKCGMHKFILTYNSTLKSQDTKSTYVFEC